MNIDEIVGRYVSEGQQRKYLILCGLAWMAVAAGIMLIPFTLPQIIKEWGLSKIQASTIASSTFVGMLLGAFISGFVSDLFGRKFANLLFLSMTTILTAVNGLANSPDTFAIIRFLSGIGYGGLLPSVNAYLSELTAIKIRGRYLAILDMNWAFGSILIGLFAVTLGTKLGWRYDYYIMSLFALLLIPFALAPESPKYVFSRKGKAALEQLLAVQIDEEIEPVENVKVPIAALFSRKYYRQTIMVWIIWFIASFVYYGLFIWLPKMFASKGIGELKSLWFTFFMMVAQIPGYLSVAYLIEKTGRKYTLAIYFMALGASAMAFALARDVTVFLIAALITSVFCLGVWGLLYAYTPELFPTSFRTTANGMAGMMARIAGIIAPYFTAYFIQRGSIVGALSWFAAMSVFAGIVVLILGVETKGKAVG